MTTTTNTGSPAPADSHGSDEHDRRLLRRFGMTWEHVIQAAEQAEDEHTPDPLTGRIHLTQHRGEAATNPDDPQDLKD